jgi:hypothetical protein
MKLRLFFLLLVFIISAPSFKKDASDDICLSPHEIELYQLMMKYRKSKKLNDVKLSRSLSLVAQEHARDLYENKPSHGNCNPHSWSDKGKWKSCCYPSDHSRAECMWDKPRELTSYSSNGYEIVAYFSNGISPGQALEMWKKSPEHNDVILNKSIWKKISWNAVGIGIYKNYATVWFGESKDAEGAPEICKK